MKIQAKITSVLLAAIILCMPVLNSCSEKENHDLRTDQLEKQAAFALNSAKILKEHFAQGRFSLENLNQERLDSYLLEIGMEPGQVKVAEVYHIVEKLNMVASGNTQEVINQTLYSNFTKEQIRKIAEGNIVDNLHLIPEFQSLSISERELLVLCNSIGQQYMNDPELRYNGDGELIPCPSSACGVSFAIVGFIAGSSICSLPCGIVGGIIGLIFGTANK